MMSYRHAAKLEPLLAVMYGRKDTVGQYKLGQVMLEMKADIDSQRLQDWTQHEYGKIAEAEAKMRRRKK